MYVKQKQLDNLVKLISPQKAVIILGPRRCGKTTLLEKFLKKFKDKYLSVTGDDISVREYLSSQSIAKLKNFAGRNKLLVIDEAQKIPDIGVNLKIILDHIPGIKIVATGSSSFGLSNQTGEPLTGRKYTLKMYPFSQMELSDVENPAETASQLENRLIFGSYPEVALAGDNKWKELYLREIIASYLYKDILELDGVRHSSKISALLQSLAFQIGHEVSFSELSGKIGISKNTIDRYLDLLEKAFVIQRLNGFSRNLRNEITKNPRYYFLDNGIRNALINNFNPLKFRNDNGMLWENYIIMELLKKQEYAMKTANNYFWRTYTRSEIDFIEEKGGVLTAYEIKYSPKDIRIPKTWAEAYPGSNFRVIHRDNYISFIT